MLYIKPAFNHYFLPNYRLGLRYSCEQKTHKNLHRRSGAASKRAIEHKRNESLIMELNFVLKKFKDVSNEYTMLMIFKGWKEFNVFCLYVPQHTVSILHTLSLDVSILESVGTSSIFSVTYIL